jgi:hypothetical protein
MSLLRKTSTLLAIALLVAGTLALPARAQQGPQNGSGGPAAGGRQLGPADGTAVAPAPKDGTGYGSPYRKSAWGLFDVLGGTAGGTGTCDGAGRKGNGRGAGSGAGTCDGSGPKGSAGGRRAGRS